MIYLSLEQTKRSLENCLRLVQIEAFVSEVPELTLSVNEETERTNNDDMRQAKAVFGRKVRAAWSLGCQLTAGAREREDSATEIYRHASMVRVQR